MKIKLFFDTSVFFAAFVKNKYYARKILHDFDAEKFTTLLVLKEFRKVLSSKGYSSYDINYFVEVMESVCIVVNDYPAAQFKKFEIADKSDKPFLCAAVRLGCILISEDNAFLKDAKRYVKSMSSEGIIRNYK